MKGWETKFKNSLFDTDLGANIPKFQFNKDLRANITFKAVILSKGVFLTLST